MTSTGTAAANEAADVFGRMVRLLIVGNAGGITACVILAASILQSGRGAFWVVLPLFFFWLGLVAAFFVLLCVHASAVNRVASQHVLVGTLMKRDWRVPILGTVNFSEHLGLVDGLAARSLIFSGILFLFGSALGMVLISLI